MEYRNVRRKRRQNRRRKYTLIFCVLLIIILFCSLFLWSFRKETADNYIHNTANHNNQKNNADYKDTKIENEDTLWNLMLVNKWNPIPENYEVNLVEVEGGEQVDKRIYKPLMKMLEGAKKKNLGKLPVVVSGYRTQETQKRLYDEKIAKFKKEGYSKMRAVEQAEQWVAVPGHSEHQLGFAVDISGASYDVYLWLQANSYKYGFIFRYPGNKTDITGVAEEVWHYRYVGVEVATEIYERGICLEEYLDKD